MCLVEEYVSEISNGDTGNTGHGLCAPPQPGDRTLQEAMAAVQLPGASDWRRYMLHVRLLHLVLIPYAHRLHIRTHFQSDKGHGAEICLLGGRQPHHRHHALRRLR